MGHTAHLKKHIWPKKTRLNKANNMLARWLNVAIISPWKKGRSPSFGHAWKKNVDIISLCRYYLLLDKDELLH